jgi:hypothetical protein
MATVSDAIVLNQELVRIRKVVDPNNDDGIGHLVHPTGSRPK